jgi:ABC-type multidrug transport system ATPase subunit
MSEAAVVCKGLEKTYRDFWGRAVHPALRGMDLTVEAGESHALLGPNGSGKTTTLRILLGLLEPTAGTVRLFGRAPTETAARRGVGFLPEQSQLPAYLTGAETLDLFGRLHDMPRADRALRVSELLARVGLADAAKRRVHEYSLGMRRRLGLAVAFVGRPRLLVLDEPTAGMDPLVRESVLGLFREHGAAGGTLLVTSHLLGDISGIAARATLLAAGRVVRTGDLGDMLRRDGVRSYRVDGPPSLDDVVRAAAESAGGRVVEAGPAHGTIEDLFLETYRETRGEDGDAGAARGRGY